jgi:hypothetical protein
VIVYILLVISAVIADVHFHSRAVGTLIVLLGGVVIELVREQGARTRTTIREAAAALLRELRKGGHR